MVVSAPRVIKKTDKDLYFPTVEARKLSANGLQLIGNLSVPTLMVNEVLGTVSSLGNAVQVRINGRITTTNELKQVAPENVKRVEWISHPGMKYGGVSAVINIVIKNPTLGGSLMVQGMQSLNTSWGQYAGSLKLNNGRSQWSINIEDKLTNKIESHRDYSETFTYPNGREITRTEKPLGGTYTENHTEFSAAYSYTKLDTTIFYVQLSGLKMWNLNEDYLGLLTLSDHSGSVLLRDKNW